MEDTPVRNQNGAARRQANRDNADGFLGSLGQFLSNPLRAIAGVWFRRTLEEKGPFITFARLCTSRHLEDLQWIALINITLFFAAGCYLIDKALLVGKVDDTNFKVASTVLGASATVITWTYLSGSKRIGSIDLFACEISVICRACLVVDFAQSSVDRARQMTKLVEQTKRNEPTLPEDDILKKFTSEEHYTPVYDGQLADLKPFDVDVVTYVTEFYTYRKTMMDYLRAIAATKELEERSKLTYYMLYMQFLMYESGRFAIGRLIEFEPNQAESLVNIFCSELVTYGFLQNHYKDDYRGKRLHLRTKPYQIILPELCEKIRLHEHPVWKKARTTAPELWSRYVKMCSELGISPVLPPEERDRDELISVEA